MPYNPSIPNPGDLLSVSQGDIKTNFTSANSSFLVNHYTFSDLTSDNGKHRYVDMKAQTIPTIVSGDGAIWANSATSEGVATETDLFYTPDNSTNTYQLTRTITGRYTLFGASVNNYPAGDGTGAVGVNYTAGWTFLPGGLIMIYGSFIPTTFSGSTGTVKLPIVYTNTIYNIQLTLIAKAGGTSQIHQVTPTNGATTASQFVWNMDASGVSSYVGFYFTVIGK